MKLGGFELGGKLAGWEIINHSAGQLPEDLASATSDLLGRSHTAIWYIANQTVKGKNHMLLCKNNQTDKYIGVIINIPPGIGGKDATIVEVIQDSDLVEGVPAGEDVATSFKEAVGKLTGCSFRPIMYGGRKITKGVNYLVFAEVKYIYPGAKPKGVSVEFNHFQDENNVVEIKDLG